MKAIGYFKVEPTDFARFSEGGKVKREGLGASGWYLDFRTNIEVVPTTSLDQPFGFREVSSDNQDVSLQGSFSYRVTDPGRLLGAYNFSTDPRTGNPLGEGYVKLPERILNIVRAETRSIVQATPLEQLLVMSEGLSAEVMSGVSERGRLSPLGVELEILSFAEVKPKPEIAAALEAAYREKLLEAQDRAVYERRGLAVEKEREIQTRELDTMLEMERKRAELVTLTAENLKAEAEGKAAALRLELTSFEDMTPEMLRAHALYQLGKDARRIGNLTITPEVLAGLGAR